MKETQKIKEINNPIINFLTNKEKKSVMFDTETTGLEKNEMINFGYLIYTKNSIEYEIDLKNKFIHFKLFNGKGYFIKDIKYKEKKNDNMFIIDNEKEIHINKGIPLIYDNKKKKYGTIFPFLYYVNIEEYDEYFFNNDNIELDAIFVHKIYNKSKLIETLKKMNKDELINLLEKFNTKIIKKYYFKLNKIEKMKVKSKEILKVYNGLKKLINTYEKLEKNFKGLKNKEKKDYIDFIYKLFENLDFKNIEDKKYINEDKEKLEKIKNIVNNPNYNIEGHNVYGYDIVKVISQYFPFKNHQNVLDTMQEEKRIKGNKKNKTLDNLIESKLKSDIKKIKKEINEIIKSNKDELLKEEIKNIETNFKLIENNTPIDLDNIKFLLNKTDKIKQIYYYIQYLSNFLLTIYERDLKHEAKLDSKLNIYALQYLTEEYVEKYGLNDPFKILVVNKEKKEVSEEELKKIENIPYFGIKTNVEKYVISKDDNIIQKLKENNISKIIINNPLENIFKYHEMFGKENIDNFLSVNIKIKDDKYPELGKKSVNLIFSNKNDFENAKLLIRNFSLNFEELMLLLKHTNTKLVIHPELDKHFNNNLKDYEKVKDKIYVKFSPNIPFDYENNNINNKPLLWIGNEMTNGNLEDKLEHYIYRNLIDNSPLPSIDIDKIKNNPNIYPDLSIPDKKELLSLFPYKKYKEMYENTFQLAEQLESFDPSPTSYDFFPPLDRIFKDDIEYLIDENSSPQEYRKLLVKIIKQEMKKNNFDLIFNIRSLSSTIKILKGKIEILNLKETNELTTEEKKLLEFAKKIELEELSIDKLSQDKINVIINQIRQNKYISKIFEEEYKKYTDSFNQRLEYELSSLEKFENYKVVFKYYFLVFKIKEILEKHGIYIGPGRGSAAGSLIFYILKVTKTDPLINQLLFERFLNPERVSLPDVDIDIPVSRKEIYEIFKSYFNMDIKQLIKKLKSKKDITFEYAILNYIKETNKEFDYVTKIGTVSYFSEKVIFEILRIMGMKTQTLNEIRKKFNDEVDIIENIKSIHEIKDYFPEIYKLATEQPNVFKQLVNMKANTGEHAGGFRLPEISENNEEFVNDGKTVTDKTNYYNEAKMDMLGLLTLTAIYKIISDIKKKKDEWIKKINEIANNNNFYIIDKIEYNPELKDKMYKFFKNKFEKNEQEIIRNANYFNELPKKLQEKLLKIDKNMESYFNYYKLDQNIKNMIDILDNSNIVFENIKLNSEDVFYKFNYEKLPENIKLKLKQAIGNEKYVKNLFDYLKYKKKILKVDLVSRSQELLNFDDINVYKTIMMGLVGSIFQIENEQLANLIKELYVDNFETLVAAIALYRPGPLQTGDVEKYVYARKNKLKKELFKYLNKYMKTNKKTFEELSDKDYEFIYNMIPKQKQEIISLEEFKSILNVEDYYSTKLFEQKIRNNIDINKIEPFFENEEYKNIDFENEEKFNTTEKILIRNILKTNQKYTSEVFNKSFKETLEYIKNMELNLNKNPYYKEITKETNGVIVYQEQIMLLVRALGQFTKGEADALRKVIAKSKKEQIKEFYPKIFESFTKDKLLNLDFTFNSQNIKIERNKDFEYVLNGINLFNSKVEINDNNIIIKIDPKHKDKIIQSLPKFLTITNNELKIDLNKGIINKLDKIKGMKPDQVNYLFDSIVGFGSYAFNKSHAASYAILTYQTAMLKTYYPLIFYNNMFNFSSRKSIEQLLSEIDKQDYFDIGMQDINTIKTDNIIQEDKNQIFLSPVNVKGIQENIVNFIETEKELNGKYENIFEFLIRNEGLYNKGVLELGKIGFFKKIQYINLNDKTIKLSNKFFKIYGDIFYSSFKKYYKKFIKDFFVENILSTLDNNDNISKKNILKVVNLLNEKNKLNIQLKSFEKQINKIKQTLEILKNLNSNDENTKKEIEENTNEIHNLNDKILLINEKIYQIDEELQNIKNENINIHEIRKIYKIFFKKVKNIYLNSSFFDNEFKKELEKNLKIDYEQFKEFILIDNKIEISNPNIIYKNDKFYFNNQEIEDLKLISNKTINKENGLTEIIKEYIFNNNEKFTMKIITNEFTEDEKIKIMADNLQGFFFNRNKNKKFLNTLNIKEVQDSTENYIRKLNIDKNSVYIGQSPKILVLSSEEHSKFIEPIKVKTPVGIFQKDENFNNFYSINKKENPISYILDKNKLIPEKIKIIGYKLDFFKYLFEKKIINKTDYEEIHSIFQIKDDEKRKNLINNFVYKLDLKIIQPSINFGKQIIKVKNKKAYFVSLSPKRKKELNQFFEYQIDGDPLEIQEVIKTKESEQKKKYIENIENTFDISKDNIILLPLPNKKGTRMSVKEQNIYYKVLKDEFIDKIEPELIIIIGNGGIVNVVKRNHPSGLEHTEYNNIYEFPFKENKSTSVLFTDLFRLKQQLIFIRNDIEKKNLLQKIEAIKQKIKNLIKTKYIINNVESSIQNEELNNQIKLK